MRKLQNMDIVLNFNIKFNAGNIKPIEIEEEWC